MGDKDENIGAAFIAASKERASGSLNRIKYSLSQLQEEDIWWRPDESTNSIGILIQHLCGNLRQWIISGVGGADDVRVRYLEFKADEQPLKKHLLNNLMELVKEVLDVLSKLKPENLLESRRIQGFDETVLSAIYDTLSHFELHAGQIVYITRLRLGENYVTSWEPTTKEQGAE